MRYEYHRTREGPNWFMCYYKNMAQIRYDPKEAWRTLDKAKFTDTGKALKEWCLSIHEEYGVEDDTCSKEEKEEDKTGASVPDTKMII